MKDFPFFFVSYVCRISFIFFTKYSSIGFLSLCVPSSCSRILKRCISFPFQSLLPCCNQQPHPKSLFYGWRKCYLSWSSLVDCLFNSCKPWFPLTLVWSKYFFRKLVRFGLVKWKVLVVGKIDRFFLNVLSKIIFWCIFNDKILSYYHPHTIFRN